MLDFNLEYYRAFYYVAQLGSISKAAEALYLSQPAVTRSIRKLEEILHCSLFARGSRGMKPTAEGEMLFRHVSKAFSEMITGEKELQRMVAYPGGKLEIGITETAMYHFLLPKMRGYLEQNANVTIHLAGSATPEIIKMIRAGKVDFAIVVSPLPDTKELVATKVRSFHDIFIAGEDYAHLKNKTLTSQELCSLPLAVVESGTSARRHLDTWFQEQGILFQPEYSVRTSSLVLPFVKSGLAVGVVPSMFAEEPIRHGEVFRLREEKEILPRDIFILYRQNGPMTLLCRRFIEYLCAGEV